MPFINKNFTCFKCHFFNSVRVPHHFKGVKCEICRTFNYFNYIPNYRRRRNNINQNSSNNNRNNHRQNNQRNRNRIRIKNNSNNLNNFYIPFSFNPSNNIHSYSLNNSNDNTIINSIYDFDRNIYDENMFLSNEPLDNYLFNDVHIYNNNTNNINLNRNYENNLISVFNNDNNFNDNKKIKYSWLNKQKITEKIKTKYKNEKCSICLEEYNGDISVSKCNHIFHYNCISSYIENTGKKDCPICRCNLQTGQKKEIEDNKNNIFGRQIYENNNNYMNYFFGNENIRNQNLRINQRENETNLYGNRDEQINRNNRNMNSQFQENIGVIIIVIIIIYLLLFKNL